MAQGDRGLWLPSALLLLGLPGCVSLSGPNSVKGIMGRSLSVQCRYEEKYRNHLKYWCRSPCLTEQAVIVKTRASEREVRSGHVSIRDEPAALTFTVTWENLTEEDAGKYCCGIDRPLTLTESWLDLTVKVTVSVFPAPTGQSPTSVTAAKTSTPSTTINVVSPDTWPQTFHTPATESTTHSASILEEAQSRIGFQVLLPLLAFLLLLLGASSLLAWRMVRRQAKAGRNSVPLQNSSQSEPCYANLELQTRPLQGQPMHPRPEEVVYSTVAAPKEDVHYTTVVFAAQDSKSDENPFQRPVDEQPVYSLVKKR
ncbi:CMRF35-like molecule 8 [Erinaceus europaeus]|uniref:CMRF35-like molecule 8 n=1 Tax=Erinaceus europaeus TaxID=9365 RepID=A0A1S3WCR7_ERIEU|nr:CMRF35-like molecule 8 [Erinaceus europaeus]